MSGSYSYLSGIPEEGESPVMGPHHIPTQSIPKTPIKTPAKTSAKTPIKNPVKTPAKTPTKTRDSTPITTPKRAVSITPAIVACTFQSTLEPAIAIQPYSQADPLSVKLLALHQMEAEIARIKRGEANVREEVGKVDAAMEKCRQELDELVGTCYGGGGGGAASSPEKMK
ncbi:hypothetical protein B0J12DRAFT_763861 [Macrophomina phaseolina]|uniref:Uncharacterized protein n=1 Tax=Macrophomina phaseolina TaxID=35725 RepID=A0ABQ8GTT3_9PEZI|nr:hypothetical protein B0J12DRAFT_763861 [Macrophomina phaseolina]